MKEEFLKLLVEGKEYENHDLNGRAKMQKFIDNTGRRNDNAKTKEKYFEPCIQVGVHI